jgi:ornithine carbamoyltransferase
MSMQKQLAGRSLLTLTDLTDGEFLYLLGLADSLKKKKSDSTRGTELDRKHIALIFEKMSTRTRCACAVAASDEGGATEYLTSHDIHLGKKESVKDTARVLGRMFDGIMFRGFKQETVDLLAKHSGVPVWNGLTDLHHPTQGLADLMTIRETFGKLRGLKVVYVGDGRNNVATSLMLACAKVGIHFVNCTPEALMPDERVVSWCKERARLNGGSVSIDTKTETAVVGANVIYTDVWVSMGEEDKQAERIALLSPYQVTMEMMQRTGNLESKEVIFLHCLPAFHDSLTEVTKESGALEVTDDVFEASFSKVFDEAENRMHTIKALFVSAIGQGQ